MTSRLPDLQLDGVSLILCVAAHPDDLEYGVSCAVARWHRAGIAVSYLLLTRGEAGIAEQDPRITGPARAHEQTEAGRIVGVADVRFLDHPDGLLEASLRLREDVSAAIRELRPEAVVTSTWELEVGWGLNHADHRAGGIAVVDAVRDAGNPWVFGGHGGEAWQPRLLLVAGHSRPTHRLALDEEDVELGVASLAAHESYLAALPGHPSPEETVHQIVGADSPEGAAVTFRVWEL